MSLYLVYPHNAPSHMTLPNNQKYFLKPGKAPLVIAETSSYPNAPTRAYSGDF
jgi:hypothetical protein